ncbi:hypothetical protein CCR85_04470 [Rhodothalassium salexigens]|uniref:hypothetical protein n=1 Tax=Rhodothalassium salexigens TaxID=1086 RepID=UPI0019148330|nr:hypothetical protein [Rhodothalassium salexigens]MBK5910746.1 hypothetical protein [Rhodothalassium salexigens]MBK5919804.1 hypothetical protein [Rhodothalassium salexigens]
MTVFCLTIGMHFGGVWPVSQVLDTLGVPALDDAAGLPPATIQRINEALYMLLGSGWDDSLSLDEGWWRDPELDEIRVWVDTVLGRAGDSGIAAASDPRLSILAPFWLDRMARRGDEPRVVVVLSHPFQVAGALAYRYGTQERRAIHLWLKHMLWAERVSRGARRVILPVDRVRTHLYQAAEDLARGLAFDPAPSYRHDLEQKLLPTLKCPAAPAPDADDKVYGIDPLAQQTYDLLLDAAARDLEPAPAALDDLRAAMLTRQRGFDPLLVDEVQALRRFDPVPDLEEETGSHGETDSDLRSLFRGS